MQFKVKYEVNIGCGDSCCFGILDFMEGEIG